MDQEILNLFDRSNIGKYLYHYTSLSSAISILSTNALLFSSLKKLNDMGESWRPIICRSLQDGVIEECCEAVSSYVQISLTCEDNPNNIGYRRGFDIAPMWGHYAEGGNGICIVFNKEKIINTAMQMPDCFPDYVSYEKDLDIALVFKSSDPKKEIKEKLKEFFFHKSDQWQYEQEFRIIKKKGTQQFDYLDISDSVEAVIFAKMGTEIGDLIWSSRRHWALSRVAHSIQILGYDPRSSGGSRSLYRDKDGKEVWSSTSCIVDLESGIWHNC